MSKLSSFRPRVNRILVVDDEPDIAEALKDLFEETVDGAQVLTAGSGEEALAILEREDVDLILSDYKMPGMDGLTFLTRAREAKPNVPRILITAFPQLDAAVRAINEAAIENFFAKPFNTDQVLDAVNAALIKRRRLLQQEQAARRPVRHERPAGPAGETTGQT